MSTAASQNNGGGAERRPSSFRRWGAILTGVIGVAILLSLMVWQIQRLAWKEDLIARLEERLAAAPTPLPKAFDPGIQEFSRVTVRGSFPGEPGEHGFVDAPLLTSKKFAGPGYWVIQPFDTVDGRRIMVDRGYVPIAEKNEDGAAARPTPAPEGVIELTGALRWPELPSDKAYGETDNVWTARDLSAMARLFGAEQVLIIAETSTAVGDWPAVEPLKTIDIRNNHLEYAITWGLLALGWAAMTGVLVFRDAR